MDISIGSGDQVYVALVQSYDSFGGGINAVRVYIIIGVETGGWDEGTNRSDAVAVSDNFVYRGGYLQLLKRDRSGALLDTWGDDVGNTGNSQFRYPNRIAQAPDGSFYVLITGPTALVKHVDRNCAFLDQWAPVGSSSDLAVTAGGDVLIQRWRWRAPLRLERRLPRLSTPLPRSTAPRSRSTPAATSTSRAAPGPEPARDQVRARRHAASRVGASVNASRGIDVDAAGNFYVADTAHAW